MNLVQSKLESTKFNLGHICLGQGFLELGAIIVGDWGKLIKGQKGVNLKKLKFTLDILEVQIKSKKKALSVLNGSLFLT